MADVFLSYAREDAARAEQVAHLLDEAGWSIFWDRRVVAGAEWDEEVERELKASKCVVVLWSVVSVKSRWVRTEANFGLRRGTLVPAALDETEPPLAFHLVEAAQLHSWNGSADHPEFLALTGGIARHVPPGLRTSRPAAATAPVATRPDVDRGSISNETVLPPPAESVPAASPTPRPALFGAPVRFRADVWNLPDEPLLGFVEVPAGPFTMGSDRSRDPVASDGELPQHTVTLPRYFMGRYEVTGKSVRACY